MLNLKKLRLPISTPVTALVLLAALALLTVGGTLFLHDLFIKSPQQRQLAIAVAKLAQQQAEAIDQFVASHQAQLQKLVEDPKLQTALADPDLDTAINSWIAQVSSSGIPFSSLRVVTTDDGDFEINSNFVEIHLIRATRAGSSPAPEAARLDKWRIFFARPVVRDQQVIATLLAEESATALGAAFAGTDRNLGQSTLIQQYSNNAPVTVFGSGAGNPLLATAQQTTATPHWSVTFNASNTLLEMTVPEKWPFWLAGSLLLLTALFLASRLLHHARASLQGFVSVPVRSRERKSPPTTQPKPARVVGEPLYAIDQTPTEVKKKPEEANRASAKAQQVDAATPEATARELPDRVFRDYDIRGLANTEIDENFARRLGQTLGSLALENGEQAMVLAYDGRSSSSTLAQELAEGIVATGCNLINLGQVPTPVMNFAITTLDDTSSGVMVTASHNPPSDNGFKMVLKGHVLNSGEITALKRRMETADWAKGAGTKTTLDLSGRYQDSIVRDIAPAMGIKVVVDCGNGVAGHLAPTLLEAIGCEVVRLYCDIDGDFPNHAPDPTVPENLADLITIISDQQADLGLAIDGDGDRLVAVTGSGRIVWPDELLMIFARDVLTRQPGAEIVFDVKSTRRLHELISNYGGQPVMWKTGHAHMRNKMAATGAPVGGEFSGHLFFNDRWHGFDDSLYASARLIEILSLREQSLDEMMASFAESVTTPEIRIAIDDRRKFELIEELRDRGDFGDGKVTGIDGLRVDFAEGWGLARASNTSAALTLRFEATDSKVLEEIKGLFRRQLQIVDGNLDLNF